MIPYIEIPSFELGPINVHPFGILVAIAVLVGRFLIRWRGAQLGFNSRLVNSFILSVLVPGLISAHVLDLVFYHPDRLIANPWSLFYFGEGLSSFGGFIGALAGAVAWKYLAKNDQGESELLLPFVDLVLSVYPIAWIFGRLGCTLRHDHPGRVAWENFPLAVAYPSHAGDGLVSTFGPINFIMGSVPRYDLGFLELLFTIFMALVFVATWHKKLPAGSYVILTALLYAPARFTMDFLRIADGELGDARYWQLTFAQWSCLALFALGSFLALKIYFGVHLRSLIPRH